ncbi:MAG: DNA-processing protein DprA [Acidobacteriota bacterium]
MTPTEAVALSLLAFGDRRFQAAVVRSVMGLSTEDDQATLAPRMAGEALLPWLCRCRRGAGPADHLAERAGRQLDRAAAVGAEAIALLDPRYPPLLAAITCPPPVIWLTGQSAVLRRPAIALVGSRAATAHGLSMAERLAADLASRGIVVVSGLARGVDSAAHKATVRVGGQTIGVLGCGIDRIYPSEHEALAREMRRDGAVITEFLPGMAPKPYHFPLRNRVISGLSSAVVVVEAAEKSGALITAGAALEQGREVFVVPGPVTGDRNRGGHRLIRDGARIVESADDILLDLCGEAESTGNATPRASENGHEDELPVAVDFSAEEVAVHTGQSAAFVLSRLLELELAGRIRRIGGGRFSRVLT